MGSQSPPPFLILIDAEYSEGVGGKTSVTAVD
jgi:hypothetical protein